MNDRIKLTTGGGGCLSVFGLPFLLSGLFVLVGPELFDVPIHNESGGEASMGLRLVLGGLFTSIGGALVFGRSGLVIDKVRDEITLWWGILIPFSRKTSRRDDYEIVTMHREIRTSSSSNGGSRSHTVYPVRLRAKSGEPVDLMEFQARQKARVFAERVAKTLDMGIVDATGVEERIRAAGTLDDSLRMQLRDAPPPAPKQLSLKGATFSTEGSAALVEIAAPGFLRAGGLQASIGLLGLPFLLVFAGATGFASGNALPLLLGFFGIVAVFTGVPVILALGRAKTAERLRISADSVEVERHGPPLLSGRGATVAMDDLEEVEVLKAHRGGGGLFGLGSSVGLQTDASCVQVGAGLGADEQRWLCDLIRYVAAHQRAPEPSLKG